MDLSMTKLVSVELPIQHSFATAYYLRMVHEAELFSDELREFTPAWYLRRIFLTRQRHLYNNALQIVRQQEHLAVRDFYKRFTP